MNRRVIRWWNESQQEILIDNVSCHGLAMDKDGYPYVSDWKKHEVRKWKMGEGKLVAGGNGRGNNLNQLYHPERVIVDKCGGKGSNQLSYPPGLSFDAEGNLYIVDFGNVRIQKFDLVC
ncbi:unnamed protein product [Adineta ricciae]|uniref:Uncharacterized protein n=1 Tax=Adineta ricciae TaxID=249248 RepID=A0A815JJF3_ADIRI|nr:unnamed protein product [Adineta ricciae]